MSNANVNHAGIVPCAGELLAKKAQIVGNRFSTIREVADAVEVTTGKKPEPGSNRKNTYKVWNATPSGIAQASTAIVRIARNTLRSQKAADGFDVYAVTENAMPLLKHGGWPTDPNDERIPSLLPNRKYPKVVAFVYVTPDADKVDVVYERSMANRSAHAKGTIAAHDMQEVFSMMSEIHGPEVVEETFKDFFLPVPKYYQPSNGFVLVEPTNDILTSWSS